MVHASVWFWGLCNCCVNHSLLVLQIASNFVPL